MDLLDSKCIVTEKSDDDDFIISMLRRGVAVGEKQGEEFAEFVPVLSRPLGGESVLSR